VSEDPKQLPRIDDPEGYTGCNDEYRAVYHGTRGKEYNQPEDRGTAKIPDTRVNYDQQAQQYLPQTINGYFLYHRTEKIAFWAYQFHKKLTVFQLPGDVVDTTQHQPRHRVSDGSHSVNQHYLIF